MKTINGDLTEIISGAIFQCVNCQNKMGSGLARSLYEKWPEIKTEYHKFCGNKNPLNLLGEAHDVELGIGRVVINCFGQLHYGNAQKTGTRYADYGAIKSSFVKAADILIDDYHWNDHPKPIYFPFNFASGLAGGNVEIIHELIGIYFPNAILVELP